MDEMRGSGGGAAGSREIDSESGIIRGRVSGVAGPTLGGAVAEILVRCSLPLGCYKIANSGLFASICRTISSFETGRALHFPVDVVAAGHEGAQRVA